jgi:hypothetical protein
VLRCGEIRHLVGVVAALFLCGACATSEQQIAQASVVQVADDQFKPFREYSSGPLKSSSGDTLQIAMLAVRIDRKAGARQILTEVSVHYTSGWDRNYLRARDSAAQELPTKVVARNGQCRKNVCDRWEIVNIGISETALRQAPGSGYQFKLFASKTGDDVLVTLPKPVIVSLFAKADGEATPASSAPAATASTTAPAASQKSAAR